MKLGQTLQALLKERRWTLAKLAREANVPTQTLHGWITGRRSVDLKQIQKVAQTFQISIHHLIFGEPDPYDPPADEILRELFSGDVRVTIQKIERLKPSKRK